MDMEVRSSTQPAITEAGEEKWLSIYLYDEGGARAALLEVVPFVLRQLRRQGAIDSFFFVRYVDDRGPHLRLRLRLLDRDAAPACLQAVATQSGERFAIASVPYELETERYGGSEALPASLAYFAISSAHALAFENAFGDLPRARQTPLTLCMLLWQAWGFARDQEEFRHLLGYYNVGPDLHPEMVALAEDSFRRSEGKLTALVARELGRLLAHDPGGEVSLASASSIVSGTRPLSTALADLEPGARWSVGSSQMHMTANRLGLTNAQETYAAQVLTRAIEEIAASPEPLWKQTVDALKTQAAASVPQEGATRLRAQARAHFEALLEEEEEEDSPSEPPPCRPIAEG